MLSDPVPSAINTLSIVPEYASSISTASSSQLYARKLVTLTVPPNSSIPSSRFDTTSTFSITVPDPTPPRVRPLSSLPSPISAPPCRIETYFSTPEDSVSFAAPVPGPYFAQSAPAAIPSIKSSPPSSPTVAVPKITIPPQSPFSVAAKVPSKGSSRDVNTIG